MDQYETLIDETGALVGIQGLRPDEDGAVQLLFDDLLPVVIQPDPHRKHVARRTSRPNGRRRDDAVHEPFFWTIPTANSGFS